MFEVEGVAYKEKLVIPQAYHAGMTADIVKHWGNHSFPHPPHHSQLIEAAESHHFGAFGLYDMINIADRLGPEELAKLFVAEVSTDTTNPNTRIMILHHNLRVMTPMLKKTSPENPLLSVYTAIEAMYDEQLARSTITPEELRYVDGVMCVADKISFDFCAQKQTPRSVSIGSYGQQEQPVALNYQILPDRNIHVYPWPFQNPKISGILTAFPKNGYPQNLLERRRIPYTVSPGNPDIWNAVNSIDTSNGYK